MNTKEIGEISEANILAALVTNGWTVSKTFGDNKRYDMVAESPSSAGLLRVQCKTGRLSDGVVAFSCCSKEGRYNLKKDYHGQIELFAVYCPENSKVYIVPIEDCGTSRMHMRVEYPRNNADTSVNWAAKYVLGGVPLDHFDPSRGDVPPDLTCGKVLSERQVEGHESQRRFNVTKEELNSLVWSKPLREVASQFGISDVSVKKACKRLGVSTPTRGHWLKAK
jgi:hypothetical protein